MTDLEPLSPEEGIERYLRHREPSVRESTMRKARSRLRFFQEWCDENGIDDLNDLTGRDIAEFVDWRRPEVAAITLQKQLSTLRVALRFWADIEAVEDGLAEKVHAPELPDGAESRERTIDPGRMETILDYLEKYQYASRRHVILTILWRTGMRRSALRSIDVDDLRRDEFALVLEHRPEEGTKLKNGEDGERWVYLGPKWYSVVDDYLDNPERPDVTDDHGRKPLITTEYGRPSADTFYVWVNRATQPCEYGECPHDRDPDDCEARGVNGFPSKCPSSRSPHDLRRAAITHHLNEGVSPEIASERMDVSLEILYEHYDVRTDREKMEVRKNQLPE